MRTDTPRTDALWETCVMGNVMTTMREVAERMRDHGKEMEIEVARMQVRLDAVIRLGQRLQDVINAPEIHDFTRAITIEAAHQRVRWTAEHDAGKSPGDWLWLVAYLCTKADQANRYGDREKYLHHIITAAAACSNWHAHASGTNTEMRPGQGERNDV